MEIFSYWIYFYFLEGVLSLTPHFSYTDSLSLFYVFMAFFLGGALASFACVLAERIPAGKKWWGRERSHCDTCGKTLVWYELLPVLSYAILGGKCKKCRSIIPPCYFKAELFSGIFMVASYMTFGMSFNMLISTLLVPFFVFHYITDIRKMFLYDGVTAGIALVALAYRLHVSMVTANYHLLVSAFIACLIAILLTVPLSIKGWFGSGDVLLLGALSILLGKYLVFPIFFIASCIGLFSILVNTVTGYFCKEEKELEQVIPFGPSLCIAASIIWLMSPYCCPF